MRDYLRLHCADEDLVGDVVLCLEEAATNAIRHSGSGEAMRIELRFEDDELHCLVADHGKGFDVVSFDPDAAPDLLAPGGRGLFLISQLMDEMSLRVNGGLQVRMVKKAVKLSGLPAQGDKTVRSDLSCEPDYGQTRQRAMTEEMGEAFATLDWEYRLTYVNRAGLQFFGLHLDEVVGTSFWEIFPETRSLPVGEAVRGAMQLGLSSITEYVSPKVGRWVETRVYPTTSGVCIYLHDIDVRKRKELERDALLAALRESEGRLRRFYEAGLVGVIYWNTDGESSTPTTASSR